MQKQGKRGTNHIKALITVYQKPTCSTCRRVSRILKERGVPFEAVDYFVSPLTVEKLKELIRKMGISARELLRTKEPIYKKLGISGKGLSDEEIIRLMVKHPGLVQRPIVEKGENAVLARPAERIRKLL